MPQINIDHSVTYETDNPQLAERLLNVLDASIVDYAYSRQNEGAGVFRYTFYIDGAELMGEIAEGFLTRDCTTDQTLRESKQSALEEEGRDIERLRTLTLALSEKEMEALLDGPILPAHGWIAGYKSDDPAYPEDILSIDDSGGYSVGKFAELKEALFVATARNAITRALAEMKGEKA